MLIPLKVDVYMWRRPWVCLGLIVFLVLMHAAIAPPLDPLWQDLAGIRLEHDGLGTRVVLDTSEHSLAFLAVSSTFLHADWLHLAGNLLFLWVFGSAVNYKMGHTGFLAVYLASGFVGSMAHYAFTGEPAVGASGAIFGLVGAFLMFFPRNDMSGLFWVPFSIIIRPVRFSSMWAIVFWVGWDILMIVLGSDARVAFWGHVGGFFTGFAIALACARLQWIKSTPDEQSLLEMFAHRQA